MDRFRPMQNNNKGFTLVELAVVVAVVALLLGTLLVPLTTQVEQRNISQTQKQLDEIKEALLGYAMVNGRLPRPTPVRERWHRESLLRRRARVHRIRPVGDARSAQKRRMGQVVPLQRHPPVRSQHAFDFNTGGTLKTVQTRIPGSSAPVNLATNLVAVVISHGPNNWGKTESGSDIVDASVTNVDEDTNNAKFHCSAVGDCTDFISRPTASSTGAAGGEFDDLLVWVPQTILFSRMVAAGKLP